MTSKRRPILLATTAAAIAAAVGLGLPTLADGPTPLQQANAAYNSDCLHFTGGDATYTADSTATTTNKMHGNNHKQPPPPPPSYTFDSGAASGSDITVFPTALGGQTLSAASCPGVTYELQVFSVDGSSLNLKSFTASTTANGPGTVSDKGSEVDIDWQGDGQTSGFAATVTTAPANASSTVQCVTSHFRVLVQGQDVTDPSAGNTGTVCSDGSSGGHSYTG